MPLDHNLHKYRHLANLSVAFFLWWFCSESGPRQLSKANSTPNTNHSCNPNPIPTPTLTRANPKITFKKTLWHCAWLGLVGKPTPTLTPTLHQYPNPYSHICYFGNVKQCIDMLEEISEFLVWNWSHLISISIFEDFDNKNVKTTNTVLCCIIWLVS